MVVLLLPCSCLTSPLLWASATLIGDWRLIIALLRRSPAPQLLVTMGTIAHNVSATQVSSAHEATTMNKMQAALTSAEDSPTVTALTSPTSRSSATDSLRPPGTALKSSFARRFVWRVRSMIRATVGTGARFSVFRSAKNEPVPSLWNNKPGDGARSAAIIQGQTSLMQRFD